MSSGSSRQLSETLDLFIKKLEQLQLDRTKKMDQSSRAVASLDRLAEILVELERLRAREMVLTEKFDIINKKMESISGTDRGDLAGVGLIDVMKKVINGTKATGQVIEIVAGGFQDILESVNNVIKSEEVAQEQENGQRGGSGVRGLDLSAILQPMNSIVQALVSQKSKEESKEDEQGGSPPPQGQVNAPEGLMNTPIVKATPAE